MIWLGAMYWNPAIPPIAAVSIDILKNEKEDWKIGNYKKFWQIHLWYVKTIEMINHFSYVWDNCDIVYV